MFCYLLIEVGAVSRYIIKNLYFRNQAVPTKTSLLLTLRYLATGSYLRSAADFCGVSPPTASRIVKKVTEAIAQLRTMIIKFPDNLSTLQDGFYEIASFPRVIGALDCTHVAIKSPGMFYSLMLSCQCKKIITW